MGKAWRRLLAPFWRAFAPSPFRWTWLGRRVERVFLWVRGGWHWVTWWTADVLEDDVLWHLRAYLPNELPTDFGQDTAIARVHVRRFRKDKRIPCRYQRSLLFPVRQETPPLLSRQAMGAWLKRG